MFQELDLLPSSGNKMATLLGPLEGASLNHCPSPGHFTTNG